MALSSLFFAQKPTWWNGGPSFEGPVLDQRIASRAKAIARLVEIGLAAAPKRGRGGAAK